MARLVKWSISPLLLALMLPCIVQARLIHLWTLKEIAEKADVLVVGKVLEVEGTGKIEAADTRWKTTLLRMNAKVEVLRAFPPGEMGSRLIDVPYQAIDREHGAAILNGPFFPVLIPGDICVFPLKAVDGGTRELIAEEDFKLIVPAVTEGLKDVQASTGLEFLRRELAATFARDNYEQVYEAGRYLREPFGDTEDLDAVYTMLENHVADEERWLDIAVATYSAMGIPRPKLSELSQAKTNKQQAGMVARSLSHVTSGDLDMRFVGRSLEHASIHTWGTAVTLSTNYADDPRALDLLGKALESGDPWAIQIAQHLIKDTGHPLAQAAVDAARQLILRRETFGMPDARWQNTRAACELIRDYGSDQDFTLLLGEIKVAKRSDRQRYKFFWQACAYAQSKRIVSICRVVIDDTDISRRDVRFCDMATLELQRVAGVDFGFSINQSISERDKAIRKAKAWLTKQGL